MNDYPMNLIEAFEWLKANPTRRLICNNLAGTFGISKILGGKSGTQIINERRDSFTEDFVLGTRFSVLPETREEVEARQRLEVENAYQGMTGEQMQGFTHGFEMRKRHAAELSQFPKPGMKRVKLYEARFALGGIFWATDTPSNENRTGRTIEVDIPEDPKGSK